MSRAVTEESKSMSKSAHDINSNKAGNHESISRTVTVELSESKSLLQVNIVNTNTTRI